MSTAGRVAGLDGWKSVAGTLSQACEKFRAAGLRAGYHNHQAEFQLLEGKRPIEVLAANTPKDFMLQFDVGTCVEVGSDPVAWIQANPGRINSIHCKDWAPGSRADEKGYRTLFGEGVCPWNKIFEAAERVGGVEYYLIEQEGYPLPGIRNRAALPGQVEKDAGVRWGPTAAFPLSLAPVRRRPSAAARPLQRSMHL